MKTVQRIMEELMIKKKRVEYWEKNRTLPDIYEIMPVREVAL